MSLLTRYFSRLLKHNEHDAVVNSLSSARCYDCGVLFWGATEIDAQQQLSRHAVFTHDNPPDWDVEAQAVDEEIGFHSEIRDRLYGAR